MSAIGSGAWARRTGGRLGMKDRFVFVASAMRSRLRRRRQAARPSSTPIERLDPSALRFIDSTLVKQTFEAVEGVYEPWLLNHCIRTYYWGGMLGQLESLAVDHEQLLVAALYHDVGLAHATRALSDHECFAVRGAEFAAQTLCRHGHEVLAPVVYESIAMHLNIAPAPIAAPYLNHLLQQGAAVDVVGFGLAKMVSHKDTILADFPRLDLKRELVAVLRREAAERPGARLALMVRFGFFDLIAAAPYAE